MVYSIFRASPFLEKEGDLLISYGDILYEEANLNKIINSNAAINVVVDMDWLKYWKLRFSNPLSDAESLILDENYSIKQLGLKTENYDDIQGQYIGLIKIRQDKIKDLINFYKSLSSEFFSNSSDFNKMYLTEFIQLLINSGWDVKATCIRGGWLEVDSLKDLEIYEELAKSEELDTYCRLEK
jgi:choline kinase